MGTMFHFYGVPSDKKETYNALLKSHIADYELQDWLEENTDKKEVRFSLSYSSASSLTTWLIENSKNSYSPDEDIFFEIDKTDTAKEEFFNLYWMRERWINPYDVWHDDTFLIIQKY